MACRDVWNTWHEGLRSPQNPTAKPEGFVATGGPRAMYFTHHGKPWLKPIIARPFRKIWYKTVVTLHKWSQQRRQSTTAIDFYNIPQCQLTISWVAMVTCGPIVFPKVLWMQHLRIIFDSNALDMMQTFKSIPMVVNWYKTEIAPYFHKWCFFYIYYQTENMNRKGIMWVKASEGTAMPCGFTRHPQHGMGKSPSKCYNVVLLITDHYTTV